MTCVDQNYRLEVFYHYRPLTEREYRKSLGSFIPHTELLFCEAILYESDSPIASATKSTPRAAVEAMTAFLRIEGNDKAAEWLGKLKKER
jgi:hypothetical protein